MKKTSVFAGLLVAAAWSLGQGIAFAQMSAPHRAMDDLGPGPQASDQDIQLLRKNVRSMRKQIIAANLELTEAQAEKFWPIFDRYTGELVSLTDKKYALLQEYAQNYATLTDDQAESYIKGRGEVDESIMQLRLKYVPIFRKVVSAKTTALLFQIDWRLGLMMDLQLASQTPMIEQ
jgi:hypothetical protein